MIHCARSQHSATAGGRRKSGYVARRFLPHVGCVAVLVFGTACVSGATIHTRHLTVVSDSLSNRRSPVALDVERVDDDELLGTLLQLSARAWFAQRAQYARDYPSTVFQVLQLEVVPGDRISRDITQAVAGGGALVPRAAAT